MRRIDEHDITDVTTQTDLLADYCGIQMTEYRVLRDEALWKRLVDARNAVRDAEDAVRGALETAELTAAELAEVAEATELWTIVPRDAPDWRDRIQAMQSRLRTAAGG